MPKSPKPILSKRSSSVLSPRAMKRVKGGDTKTASAKTTATQYPAESVSLNFTKVEYKY